MQSMIEQHSNLQCLRCMSHDMCTGSIVPWSDLAGHRNFFSFCQTFRAIMIFQIYWTTSGLSGHEFSGRHKKRTCAGKQVFCSPFWTLWEYLNWVSMSISYYKKSRTCLVRYGANTNTYSMPSRDQIVTSWTLGYAGGCRSTSTTIRMQHIHSVTWSTAQLWHRPMKWKNRRSKQNRGFASQKWLRALVPLKCNYISYFIQQ